MFVVPVGDRSADGNYAEDHHRIDDRSSERKEHCAGSAQAVEHNVRNAAITLASHITRAFKFEWNIQAYLVESGFDGDHAAVGRINDFEAIALGALLLIWAFSLGFVLNAVEAVALALNEKRILFGDELIEIINLTSGNLRTPSPVFPMKEELEINTHKYEEIIEVLSAPEEGVVEFLGSRLIVSYVNAKKTDGKEFASCTVLWDQLKEYYPHAWQEYEREVQKYKALAVTKC